VRGVILVRDLEENRLPPEMHLREAFGLTRAEAKLAARLAGGEPIDAAAEILGIAKATARSQLKAVFAKTDTRRQSELVALAAHFLGRRSRNQTGFCSRNVNSAPVSD